MPVLLNSDLWLRSCACVCLRRNLTPSTHTAYTFRYKPMRLCTSAQTNLHTQVYRVPWDYSLLVLIRWHVFIHSRLVFLSCACCTVFANLCLCVYQYPVDESYTVPKDVCLTTPVSVSLSLFRSLSRGNTVNEKGNGDLALIEEDGNVQAISRNPPAECT